MNHFGRVSHSLRADTGMTAAIILCGAILLSAGWLGWACCARIVRVETSDTARLEIDSAPYPVQASTSGRLVSNYMNLGRRVQAGDVLFELDTRSEKLTLQEENVRLAALQPQLAAVMQQTEEESQGRADERRVLSFSTEAARAQFKEAEAQALSAAEVAKRAAQLQSEGIMATADADRAKAEAVSKEAAAESLRAGLAKLAPELEVRERERAVRLRQLAAEVAKIEADMATASATAQKLSWDIERRRVRAPISGRLAECAPVKPGSQIAEGQQLGVILPEGNLEIVAGFEPSAALGKIRTGQQATLRLQGFPWAQYGTVHAAVSRVASEIRDGKVRVELAVRSSLPSGISLQHGLPGTVEVEVEQTTPMALLLRSAGQVVASR
jgi:multidrug resistance efflux pump